MKNTTRKPNHPGVILKHHYLEPLDLSVTELAQVLDISRKTLSTIVNGRGAVTPDVALRLSRALKTSPELWLNLQQNYNLWVAAHESKGWRKVPVLKLELAAVSL